MDNDRFDRLAKSLSAAGSRRGLLARLLALPLAGSLAALLDEETAAAGRRKRRKARHRHRTGKHKENRKGQRKGQHKRKKRCTPDLVAETCAGTCGIVTNNCGKPVDCGPCTCATGCPACQTCDAATGLCVPVANDTPCDDGNACTVGDTCQAGVCTAGSAAPNRSSCGGSNTCCNSVCCSGCCGSDGTCGTCLAFVTSDVTNATLGGLTGADSICQNLANNATPTPLPGTYKAWLSDDTGSPATRFRQSALPYTRVDGVAIASSWAELTDGFLLAPISVTELNTPFGGPSNTWTHTLTDGTAGGASNQHCTNWSTDDPGVGDGGLATSSDPTWTVDSALPCELSSFHLYCFQQE